MRTVQLREAKAQFSALVQAAENGETTIVTKHGRPAAKLVPFHETPDVKSEKKPSFADWLMSMPHDIPIRRNRSRARSVKF
jgi:prevent-host-death family protein